MKLVPSFSACNWWDQPSRCLTLLPEGVSHYYFTSQGKWEKQ